ncbi:MAG: TonB C-terminal domain-containing protein [Acidimicrobiia bacterium]|nr:TonB C-terminal domain-containing protein [Acidimicrobiia bacterium]
MYFDFEDHRPDTPHLVSPLTWRDVVFLTIIVHLTALLAIVTAPRWMPAFEVEREERAQLKPPPRDNARFVFVQPRMDTPSPKPPPRAELSDQDRMARQRERAPQPSNPLPYSRGDSTERVERLEDRVARGQGLQPEPAPEAPQPQPAPQSEDQAALTLPDATTGRVPQAPPTPMARAMNRPSPGGRLGDALRNLDRYIQKDHFDNTGGDSGAFGPAIQFDTKGVEFGPWIRRFVAQVKRNWLIPYAAMSMRGRVVITFNVHKDGSLSDLMVVGPSPIEAFNNAAYGALASSNPTQPLPPEYPSDKAFFTVTFFYNEQPQ